MARGVSVTEFSQPSSRSSLSVAVEIGAIPILLRPSDPEFCRVLERRYAGFLNPRSEPDYQFDIQLDSAARPSDENARVFRQGPLWFFQRGDFSAQWDSRARRGRIHQCPNPFSIDAVLRITHSLLLAEQGGFLVHASSAICGSAAYLFAGVSGAGKTTMMCHAPADATLLTDEISYVRRIADGYRAYGTPFAGELARSGENTSAPLTALYLLVQGPENRIQPIARKDAACALMRHILFFAHEKALVTCVFDAVLEFVSRVEVSELIFTPDARPWELVARSTRNSR